MLKEIFDYIPQEVPGGRSGLALLLKIQKTRVTRGQKDRIDDRAHTCAGKKIVIFIH